MYENTKKNRRDEQNQKIVKLLVGSIALVLLVMIANVVTSPNAFAPIPASPATERVTPSESSATQTDPISTANDSQLSFGTLNSSRLTPTQDTFGVPVTFSSVYVLKEDKLIDLGPGAIRHEVRIMVPEGLSNTVLENNLRDAAKHVYKPEENPRSIHVLAYKTGTDWHKWDTAGLLDWAPFGDWNRAGEDVPVARHSVNFELSETYHPEDVVAAKKRQDALFPEIDAQIRRDEAKVNRRIRLRRRKQIYYSASKALYDKIRSGSDGETKENVAAVCHTYHISYDTEETIRQEGIDEGWPDSLQ